MVSGMPDFGLDAGYPQTSAPMFFTFEESDFLSAIPGYAGLITVGLLGLPSLPQLTSDYCKVPPPTDLATVADFAEMALPLIGAATGAYQRLGNLIKARKWAEYCVHPSPPILTGNVYCVPEGRTTNIDWMVAVIPAQSKSVSITLNSWSGMPEVWPTNHNFRPSTYVYTTDNIDDTGGGGAGGTDEGSYSFTGLGDTWTDSVSFPNPVDWYLHLQSPFHPNPGDCFGISVTIVPGTTKPPDPLPDPVSPPDGYPSDDPCATPTLSDLCRALAALNNKVDYLVNTQTPPRVVADNTEVPVPDGSDPEAPKGKLKIPPAATGAVVQIGSIPSHAARYGSQPTFYPALGHVALGTVDGPYPSILIKHNPMVVWPFIVGSTELLIDLEPGVSGSVRWLWGLT